MNEVKIEKFTLEDGREAERHIKQEIDDSGSKRVVDLYVSPEPPPKYLSQRVIEHEKPCIYLREIETINQTGEVVSREVQTLDPDEKVEMAENGCKMTCEQLKALIGHLEQTPVTPTSTPATPQKIDTVAKQSVVDNFTNIVSGDDGEISQISWWLLMAIMAQFAGLTYIWLFM